MASAVLVAAVLTSCAAVGVTWKEEVLQHDGTRIVVERSVQRGGRHEIGQRAPIQEQRLMFGVPGSKQDVVWEDAFTADVGGANFLPMLLNARDKVAYLVAYPMGCLAYNKWGRPNPPYVVFKYQERQWARISLLELPGDIVTPNLIFSSPDTEAKKTGEAVVSAGTIAKLYADYSQPEFKTILREPLARNPCPQIPTGAKAPNPISPAQPGK
jgi:hypothetical protein